MIKRIGYIILMAASVGFILTPAALAFSCPVNIASFDKTMASGPTVSAEVLEKAVKLRNKAEQQHKAGDHGGSIESINAALDLIGAE